MAEIKDTRRVRRVLTVLLTGAANLSAYPVSRMSGIGSGAAYRTLARLERAGWVSSEWEEHSDGKDRRRFYALTRQGRAKATGLLGLEMAKGEDGTDG